MSKKIFFIVLTCCLLVATFCVSFAGAPQVQSAPADIRAVLDRPDCAAAPLIVPPVVEPPLSEVVSLEPFVSPFQYIILSDFSDLPSGRYAVSLDDVYATFMSFDAVSAEDASPRFSILGFYDVESIDIPFSLFALYNSTFESFVVDTESQTIYLSFVGGGSDIACSYVGSGVVYLEFYDSFKVLDADDQILGSADGSGSVHGLFYPFSNLVNPVVDTLVSGLRALGTNVGRAFSTMANAIFINAGGTGLSTFGILVVVFAAISLGLSLTRWVLNFCSSWGKRNR